MIKIGTKIRRQCDGRILTVSKIVEVSLNEEDVVKVTVKGARHTWMLRLCDNFTTATDIVRGQPVLTSETFASFLD